MFANVQSGKLRFRVVIQRLDRRTDPASAAADDFGQAVDVWRDYAERWADVRTASARELTIADQRSAVATHLVTIRGGIDVLETDRLKFQGRILNVIQVIDPDNRDRRRELVCQEVRPC